MSFGFSVGDFVTIIGLANKIRKEFVNAPRQFKDISNEVRSLHIVLQDVEVVIAEQELTSQQETELHGIVDGCRNVLEELEKTLDKYAQVGVVPDRISKKAKRVWMRLKWEPEDISEFRTRITTNITLLSAFQGGLACRVSLATKHGVDRLHERQDDLERGEEHQKILDWITPIDYAKQQIDFISRRQEGTGQWLLDSDKFTNWVGQSDQALICSGIPGAGKTICAAIIIHELHVKFQNDASVGIAYIYCNFRRHQEQKAVDLLASLLKQFVQKSPSMHQSLRRLYEHHQPNRTRPSCDELSQALQSVISGYSKAFIVVDALDECQDADGTRKRLLAELFSLQVKTGACILATSRPNPVLEKEFKGRSTRLEIRASDYDLQRYIDGNITRLPSFVSRSTDLQTEIKIAIISAVDGMFLLAQLHLDSLVGKRSPKAIRAALERLPKGSQAYDHAYSEAMERIEGQIADSRELAKQALLWITCAKRRLTSMELQHALAVEINEFEFDDQNLPEIEDVLNVCAGLLTVDEESDIIRLIHYTTQEYFERTWRDWFHDAQNYITMICLTYLSLDAFDSGYCPTDEDFEARLLCNPIYDYAATNWGHHARAASTEVGQSVIDFLGKETKVSSSSQALIISDTMRYHNYSQDRPKHLTGLHLAAYFGLAETTTTLLKNGYRLDCTDSWGRTPLSWAAKNGHETVVQVLIERDDVEADSKDKNGRTPLSWAAANGHEAVVQVLVERDDVEADSKDKNGRTPLFCAAANGHEAVVQVLVERNDVEADSKDKNGGTPLSWTAANGHEAVVQVLIERNDVEADSKDKDGRTPLSWAAAFGHEAVVQVLIERDDVEADSKNKDGRTPLSWAAANGHEAVVQVLVERDDVEADSKDKDGRTPLFCAAANGHEAVVQVLVERDDVEADSKDKIGRTPLSWAAAFGREAVVQVLVERNDVEADSKDKDGRTPLFWAAAYGHEAVVQVLVERDDVEADSKNKDGRTPLFWAAAKGHEAVVQVLVERDDVEADSKDKDGRTPLSWAAANGHEAVVKLLNLHDNRSP